MKRKYEIGVGLLLLVAFALLAWIAVQIGGGARLGERVEVEAIFQDASGLQEGAAVSVAGVEVGRVSSLRVDFDRAVITLSLEPEAQIREDVVVAIRARSVLGEKYIELRPQSQDAPLLESGDQLTNTIGTTEIDQLVNQLGPLVGGLDDEGLSALEPLLAALEEDPERPTRMLEDAEVLLHNLRVASEDAPVLVAESRQTLAETRTTLREVRALTGRIDPMLDRTDALLGQAEGLAGELEDLDDLTATLADVQKTMHETHQLMQTLNANSESLEAILQNLDDIDSAELERLLREEGVKVRLLPKPASD